MFKTGWRLNTYKPISVKVDMMIHTTKLYNFMPMLGVGGGGGEGRCLLKVTGFRETRTCAIILL